MSARLFVVIAAAVLWCGCSSVEMVNSGSGSPGYRDVNEDIRGKVVRMKLRDGRTMQVTGLLVSADSVSWVNTKTNTLESLPTRSIHELSIHKSGRGAIGGLLFGAFVGAVAGGARAAIEGDDPTDESLSITREQKLRVYPPAHALLASLATTPIGAIIGSRKVYRFTGTGFQAVNGR